MADRPGEGAARTGCVDGEGRTRNVFSFIGQRGMLEIGPTMAATLRFAQKIMVGARGGSNDVRCNMTPRPAASPLQTTPRRAATRWPSLTGRNRAGRPPPGGPHVRRAAPAAVGSLVPLADLPDSPAVFRRRTRVSRAPRPTRRRISYEFPAGKSSCCRRRCPCWRTVLIALAGIGARWRWRGEGRGAAAAARPAGNRRTNRRNRAPPSTPSTPHHREVG